MANISTYLQKIMAAVYGEEVRGSIHDALAAMNTESSNAMQFAATAKDSAKASADTAKGHADTATKKAGEALSSADRAKASETGAKASELNAISKATEATTAAAGAKASETAAANSEAIATQKANEAADSQSAAAQSEAEAKAAEERTKTIRSDVETLGAQATADKNAAEAAKDDAEAARDDALASQNAAKLSENAALVAKTAAEFAKGDAEAAKLAAQAAKTAAETAAAASALSAQQYSGKPPKPQDGTWWIWDAAQQKYIDSGIGCDLVGPTGNGIKDIQLTKGDHTPGTTDIYTVTTTDGATYNISVYNGRNGTGAGDVLGIWFDLVLPASGWLNGEITIADSRLMALSTHKYFVSADEASREEYLECGVQPRDITTTGFITFKNDTDPSEDITVNVIRFELSANGTL